MVYDSAKWNNITLAFFLVDIFLELFMAFVSFSVLLFFCCSLLIFITDFISATCLSVFFVFKPISSGPFPAKDLPSWAFHLPASLWTMSLHSCPHRTCPVYPLRWTSCFLLSWFVPSGSVPSPAVSWKRIHGRKFCC